MNRRHFVEKLGAGSLYSALLIQHQKKIKSFQTSDNSEDYWKAVRQNFPIANRGDNYLNLNSGSAGTMSSSTLNGLQTLISTMNSFPPYEALNSWKKERELVRQKLSNMLDCGDDEISIIRNTTEGINLIINGLQIDPGAGILCAKHDYPHSLFAINQRAERDKLVVNTITVNLLKGDDHIVKTYVNSIQENIKVLLLTHITHRQGYLMPIKRIVEEAHKRGIQVVLDAAHSVGQVKHSIRELDVDYYVSSLHKWLNTPHSTGLLFVKKERIKDLKSLMACDPRVEDKMVKYEYMGTRTFHQEVGILMAINELETMTIEKKERRLRYLTTYWIQKAKNIPGFKSFSSYDPKTYCAVWTFGLEGIGASKLRNALQNGYQIHTKTVGTKPVSGLRISTNIYHLKSDLDRFVNALAEISAKRGN